MPPKRILLEKNRVQLELGLQKKMIGSLHAQGWFATKTSDRFLAGRPDLRIGHNDFGQLDVELKYSLDDYTSEADTGIKKLQRIKMREMNSHGMPAVGLVYSETHDLFFVTLVLREDLPPSERCVQKLPGSEVIFGPDLFVKAMEYLNGLGYHTSPRSGWQPRQDRRA